MDEEEINEDFCPCDKWKSGIEAIDAVLMFVALHGFYYGCIPWSHCPWCGSLLEHGENND